jgi:hypothetical protein
MASVSKIQLLNGSTVTATAAGASKTLEMYQTNFIAQLKLAGRTQGTYNVKLQHSPDGVTWFDLVSFTEVAAGATADEVKQIAPSTTSVLPHIRAYTTVTVAVGDAEVEVNLFFDRRR